MPTRDLLTVIEAAEILGVTDSRVRQLVLKGRLKAIKPRRDLFLDKDEVEAFAKEDRPNGRPPKSTAPAK